MERGYVDTGLGQVHYYTAGDGPPVVLLHAANHSARQFQRLIPELAGQYRVLAPDFVGFGNSDPAPADCSIPAMAESVGDVIDALADGSAHVFGLHTGNKVGAAMGARLPDRLDKLILCGLPHSIIPDEERRDDAAKAVVADSLVTFPETADGTHLLKAWGHWQRKVADAWWDPDLLAVEGITAERIQLLSDRVIALLQLRSSIQNVYAANWSYDLTSDLERLAVETLFIELGERSEIAELGSQIDALVETAPESHGTSLDGVTAVDLLTDPAVVAEPIREFLGA